MSSGDGRQRLARREALAACAGLLGGFAGCGAASYDDPATTGTTASADTGRDPDDATTTAPPGTTVPREGVPEATEVWSRNLDHEPEALGRTAGLLYVVHATRDGGLVAFRRPETGEVEWGVDLDVHVARSVDVAVRDGVLYVGGRARTGDGGPTSRVVALDFEGREVTWVRDFPGEEFASLSTSPGPLYVTSQRREGGEHTADAVVALDADGSERWRVRAARWLLTNPVFATPVVLDDGGVVLEKPAGVLSARDPTDGSERWRVAVGERVTSTTVRPDGALFAIGPAPVGDDSDGPVETVRVDPVSGETAWTRSVGSLGEAVTLGQMTTGPGHVYVLTADPDDTDDPEAFAVHALDAGSGETDWSKNFDTSSVKLGDAGTGVVALRVAVGDRTEMQVVHATDGSVAWSRTDTDLDQFESGEFAENGDVFYLGSAGGISVLDPADGDVRWRFERKYSHYAIGPERVYVASGSGEYLWGARLPGAASSGEDGTSPTGDD